MQEREDDFYASLQNVAQLAIRNSVDAVLLAGDTFDSSKPSAKAVLVVKEFVDTMREHGIDVVGIEGNHDLTAENYWLKVCGIAPVDCGFENSFTGVRIAGVNFCHGDAMMKRLEELACECEERHTSWPVVALHCGISEMGCAFNADATLEQLAPVLERIGCKYCALGHIHIPMEQKEGSVTFVQPGSIELKSVDEPKDKFCELVEFSEAGELVSISRLRLATRKVVLVDVKTEDDLSSLADKVEKNSLVVCYVSNDIPDGVKRASETLRGMDLLYRVMPVGDESATVTCDRHDSMNLLRDAVVSFFDETSTEYRLVMDIINTSNPRLIIENYLNGKYDNATN